MILRHLVWFGPALLVSMAAAQPASTPQPIPGPAALEVATERLEGGTVTTIAFDDPGLVAGRPMLWSEDGRMLYVVDTSPDRSWLRRISLDDLHEQTRLPIEQIDELGLSSEGLVLAAGKKPEVWVLDPASLRVGKRIPVSGWVRHLAASPSLPLIFAVTETRSSELAVIDAGSGRVLERIRLEHLARDGDGSVRRHPSSAPDALYARPRPSTTTVRGLSLTPDGRYLLAIAGGCLHRFAVRSAGLVYEEIGPRAVAADSGLRVSADSRYVMAAAALPARELDDHPESRGAFVYRANDLSTPVMTVPPRCLFDLERRQLYVLETGDPPEAAVTVLDAAGLDIARVSLPLKVRTGLVHPSGGRIMLTSQDRLCWLELDLSPRREPSHVASGEVMLGEAETAGGLTLTPLQIDGWDVVRPLVFSAAGDAMFFCTRDGLVRRLTLPEFRETARRTIGQPCRGFSASSEGLLVVVEQVQEVWVLDEDDLEVRRRLSAPGVRELVAARSSSLAAVTLGTARQALGLLDLRTGELPARYDTAELNDPTRHQPVRHDGMKKPLQDIATLTMSPDGATLLVRAQGRVHRFRVDGDALRYEEVSHRHGSGVSATPLVVSDDSTTVAVPFSGRAEVPGVAASTPGVLIYDTTDLANPTHFMRTTGGAPAFAFDDTGSSVYALGLNRLTVVRAGDILRRDVHVRQAEHHDPRRRRSRSPHGMSPLRLAVHPQGRRLMAMTEDELLWVEVPARFAPPVSAVDVPEPVFLDTPLGATTRFHVADADVTRVEPYRPTRLQHPVWSQDGRFIYALRGGQRLARISVPGFSEERGLALPHPPVSLTLSRDAVVAALAELEEVWLLDPETLRVIHRVTGLPGLRRVSASPRSSRVYASIDQSRVAIIDTSAGTVVGPALAEVAPRAGPRDIPARGLGEVTVSPDGRRLLAARGARLDLYEVGEGVIRHVDGATGPTDARPRFASDPGYAQVEATGTRGASLRRLDDLGTTLVDSWADVDPLTGDLYVAEGTALVRRRPDDEHEEPHRYPLEEDLRWNVGVLAHPEGGKVLVVAGKALFWLRWSQDDALRREPVPVATGRRLLGETRRDPDVTRTTVDLSEGNTTPQIMWSADHRHFHAADDRGRLSVVAYPDFSEVSRLDIGSRISSMTLARQGLVVAVEELEEVWLLDAADLRILRRVSVPAVQSVVSAPALRHALAQTGDHGSRQRSRFEGTYRIDLERGEAAEESFTSVSEDVEAIETPSPLWLPAHLRLGLRVSGDGLFLLSLDYAYCHRYRLDSSDMSVSGHVAAIPPGRSDHGGELLPLEDPRFLAIRDERDWQLFRLDDLAGPLATVQREEGYRMLGLDADRGRVYGQDQDHRLTVHSTQGALLESYRITDEGTAIRRLLVHPDDGSLLLEAGGRLYWLSLPADVRG